MTRVSVDTAGLKEQADELNREALRYDRWLEELEETVSWIHTRDFEGAEELHRVLKQQGEEMARQKRGLLVLEESLRRISEKYQRTEEKIAESGERQMLPEKWSVEDVDLEPLSGRLSDLGLQLSGEERK